jgi:hypothetical protein
MRQHLYRGPWRRSIVDNRLFLQFAPSPAPIGKATTSQLSVMGPGAVHWLQGVRDTS